MDDNVVVAHTWKEVVDALDQSKLFMAPFCGAEDCEDEIKELSKADVEVNMVFSWQTKFATALKKTCWINSTASKFLKIPLQCVTMELTKPHLCPKLPLFKMP